MSERGNDEMLADVDRDGRVLWLVLADRDLRRREEARLDAIAPARDEPGVTRTVPDGLRLF